MSRTSGLLGKAVALHKEGRLGEAEQIYERLLRQQPRHFEALQLLGTIALASNRAARGVELIEKALALNPRVAGVYLNLGSGLLALGRYADAIASYDRAVALQPVYPEAYNNRGNALRALGRFDEALASYECALRLTPDYASAHYNRAIVLADLERRDEALESYDRAIALQPNYVDAYNNRGLVLLALGRHEDALASFTKAIAFKPDHAAAQHNRGNALRALGRADAALASFDNAVALMPDHADAHYDRGHALRDLGCHGEALDSYDRVIALQPDHFGAQVARGSTLRDLGRPHEAISAYQRAIALRPQSPEPYYNLGVVLREIARHEEAIARLEQAIERKPGDADAYYNLGIALRGLRRDDEAAAAFEKSITLNPEIELCYGDLLYAKMVVCNWSGLARNIENVSARIAAGKKASSPFPIAVFSDRPALQRKAAELFVGAPRAVSPGFAPPSRCEKLRIGYFSADFHDHATAHLVAEFFERHDKSAFEAVAFSFGPNQAGEMRQRLAAAVDRFIDVRGWSDKDIALHARAIGIDIAVDLKGFTHDARPGIFAHRAAPIQVNYLGYPGTTGAAYMDYIIADPLLIPQAQQQHFSEKIAYLPNSYQVNDTKRRVSDRRPSREDAGLPDQGFVFCCFNNNFKITPDMLDCWVRILNRVEGSVLWLLQDSETAAINLKQEAARRGLSQARLVFAERQPRPDHLARHWLAGLFLDTSPCTAHTTASDALWTGLPLLTRMGETFAGRVAASLLSAIGLPELITSTAEEYEALAIRLATHPKQLDDFKRKLAENRLTTPLFDTELTTRHIETAYERMYERHRAGLPPDHFTVT